MPHFMLLGGKTLHLHLQFVLNYNLQFEMINLVKKMFFVIEIYYLQLKTTIVDKYKLKMTFY